MERADGSFRAARDTDGVGTKTAQPPVTPAKAGRSAILADLTIKSRTDDFVHCFEGRQLLRWVLDVTTVQWRDRVEPVTSMDSVLADRLVGLVPPEARRRADKSRDEIA